MQDNKLREEILKETVGEISYTLYGDGLKNQIFEAMSRYHQVKTNSITHEEIQEASMRREKENFDATSYVSFVWGAKWFRNKLLNNA